MKAQQPIPAETREAASKALVDMATLARYWPPEGEEPQLITATVARSRIVAVKLDRQEAEVITCHGQPVAWDLIEQIVD